MYILLKFWNTINSITVSLFPSPLPLSLSIPAPHREGWETCRRHTHTPPAAEANMTKRPTTSTQSWGSRTTVCQLATRAEESIIHHHHQHQQSYGAINSHTINTITLLNYNHKHLERSNNHVRFLFVDFSSTFNTVQPHLPIQRLLINFGLEGSHQESE